MIDLHIHTVFSDGTDTPAELLNKIIKAGIRLFSITDHDDLRANKVVFDELEAHELTGDDAKEVVKPKLVSGCEISSVFEGYNVHLLCYNFRLDADSIKKMISHGAGLRKERIKATIEHLESKHNIILPDQERANILNRTVPGKVHIYDAAVRLGVDIPRQRFFDEYLNDMESREYKLPAESVFEYVTKGGGLVSLAHPIEIQREYSLDDDRLYPLVEALKNNGLTGIEAFHSLHSSSNIEFYKKIANDLDLCVSGGSDYHGRNKNVLLGQLCSHGYVPEDKELTITKLF